MLALPKEALARVNEADSTSRLIADAVAQDFGAGEDQTDKRSPIVQRECSLSDNHPLRALLEDDPELFEMTLHGLAVLATERKKGRVFDVGLTNIRYEIPDPTDERVRKCTVYYCPPDAESEEILGSSLECHVKIQAWLRCFEFTAYGALSEVVRETGPLLADAKRHQSFLRDHISEFYQLTSDQSLHPIALAIAANAHRCFKSGIHALCGAPVETLLALQTIRCTPPEPFLSLYDSDDSSDLANQERKAVLGKLCLLRLVSALQFSFAQMLVEKSYNSGFDFCVDAVKHLDSFINLYKRVEEFGTTMQYSKLAGNMGREMQGRPCNSSEFAPVRVLLTAAFHSIKEPAYFIEFLAQIIKRKYPNETRDGLHPKTTPCQINLSLVKTRPIMEIIRFFVDATSCASRTLEGNTEGKCVNQASFAESMLCAGTFLPPQITAAWRQTEEDDTHPYVEEIAQTWRARCGLSEEDLRAVRNNTRGSEFVKFMEFAVQVRLYRIFLLAFKVGEGHHVALGELDNPLFRCVAAALVLATTSDSEVAGALDDATPSTSTLLFPDLTACSDMWEHVHDPRQGAGGRRLGAVCNWDGAVIRRNCGAKILWWMFREYFSLVETGLPFDVESESHFLKIIDDLDNSLLAWDDCIRLKLTAREVFWEYDREAARGAPPRAPRQAWAQRVVRECALLATGKAREAARITDEIAQRLLDEEQEEQEEAARKAEQEARRIADRAATKQVRNDAEQNRRAKALQKAEEKAEAQQQRARQAQHSQWLGEWTTRVEAGLKHGQANFEEYSTMPEGKARASKRNEHWSRYTLWKKLTLAQRGELADVLGEAVSQFVQMYERHQSEENPPQRKQVDAKKRAEQQAARMRAEKAERENKEVEERLARERVEKMARKKEERALRKAEQERAEQEHREELERKRREAEAREKEAAATIAFGKGRGGRGGKAQAVFAEAPSPRPPAATSDEDANTCIICLDAARSHIAIACGHFLYCAGCSEKMRGKCAQCQGPTAFVKVFQ